MGLKEPDLKPTNVLDFLFNYKKILSRDRYPWVDYARGIIIILVSYRHMFEGLSNMDTAAMQDHPVLKYLNIFFFSFRMPLFFIVSGVFFHMSLNRKGRNNYITDRVATLLYPLLIWGSIQITLQLVFADQVNADRTPLDYLRLLYAPRYIEQFWYLNALFFVSMLYLFFSEVLKFTWIHQLLVGVILYFLAAMLHRAQINTGFISDICFFYLFFAVGDAISRWVLNPEKFHMLRSGKVLLPLMAVFVLVQYFFTEINLSHQDDYYVQKQLPHLFALCALIGGAFIVGLSLLLQYTGKLKFLRVIGYHSLFIYVMNLLATAGTRIIMTKYLSFVPLEWSLLIGTIAGVILPLMAYNIIIRLGGWWLFTFKKPARPAAVSPNESGPGSLLKKTSIL